MKIITANCPNCGRTADLGVDRLQTYCGYCGSKLMVDIENVTALLIEKEKTEQSKINLKKAGLEIEREKMKSKESDQTIKYELIFLIVISVFVIALYLVLYYIGIF